MAAAERGRYNLNELEHAINHLNTMRPTIQSCSSDSANHRNWASNLIYELERKLAADVGALRNAIYDVRNRADDSLQKHQILISILEAGFVGNIPPAVEQHLSPLHGHLTSGRDKLDEALWGLTNPLGMIGVLYDGLGNASWFFGEAVSAVDGLKSRVETIKAIIEGQLIPEANKDIGSAIGYIETHGSRAASDVAQWVKDYLNFKDLVIEDGPLTLRKLGLDAFLQVVADNVGPDFNIMKSGLTSLLEDTVPELLKGRIGALIKLSVILPGGVATLARFASVWDTSQALLSGLNTAQGHAYTNIARAWWQFASDTDGLSKAVDDLAHAFIDMHGGTFVIAGTALVAAGVLTFFTMGADIPVLAAVAGSAGVAFGAAAPELTTSFLLEEMAGANFSKAGSDLGDAWKDASAAVPAMFRDLYNVEKYNVQLQVIQSGAYDATLKVSRNSTYGPMRNVANSFIGAIGL